MATAAGSANHPTLFQGDITLSLNDFFVRRPGQLTQKYSLRVYDDCILAPYVSWRGGRRR